METRVLPACESCRRRKRKCDRDFPVCSYCKRGGFECVYTPTKRMPVLHPPPSAFRLPTSPQELYSMVVSVLREVDIGEPPAEADIRLADGGSFALPLQETGPKQLVLHLLQVFFDHYYSRGEFFFLHPPTFWAKLSGHHPAMILAMLSVAAPLSDNPVILAVHPVPHLRGLPFMTAMRKYLDLDGPPSLEKVVTLIMASVSLATTGQYLKRSWIYSSLALKMARSLRLDVDPDVLSSEYGLYFTKFEREYRRRIYWCCWVISLFGLVFSDLVFELDPTRSDVRLPCTEQEWLALSPDGSNLPSLIFCDYRKDIVVAFFEFIHAFLYRVYRFKQLGNPQSASPHENTDHLMYEYEHARLGIHSDLVGWYQNLPLEWRDLSRYTRFTSLLTPMPPRQPWILVSMHILFYVLIIALHRPRALQMLKSNASLEQFVKDPSVQAIFECVENIGSIYERQVFPTSQYLSQFSVIIPMVTLQSFLLFKAIVMHYYRLFRMEFGSVPPQYLSHIRSMTVFVRAIDRYSKCHGSFGIMFGHMVSELREICKLVGLPIDRITQTPYYQDHHDIPEIVHELRQIIDSAQGEVFEASHEDSPFYSKALEIESAMPFTLI